VALFNSASRNSCLISGTVLLHPSQVDVGDVFTQVSLFVLLNVLGRFLRI